jgi:glycosyltransferase involved in cell wall biosynthesis/tetratricopeptide (TPR) repeat protein
MNNHGSVSPGEQQVTIGIDARTFQYTDSTSRGIGHYALHHLLAVAPLRPDWRFILFNDTGKANPATERLLKSPQFSLHGYDAFPLPEIALFHIPDPMNMSGGFDSPFRLFRTTPASVIFHDLIPLRLYWNAWDESTRQAYLLRLDQLRNRSACVLTNSEFTRLDLIKGGGIPAERIEAIMAGLNQAENGTADDPALIKSVREKHGINGPFFLHVGALDPHKNFETVIQAFGRLSRGSARLVVVGQKQHFLKQVADYVAQQKMKDIIFTGYIPRPELEALYQDAVALLFLSRYEGFGFPVLEAMAQGCPVITTNVTSLPEVVGDAAVTFDPGDSVGVAQEMQRLLGSFTRREDFRRKGLAQAAKFTWEKTARKTITAWERMLGIATAVEPVSATAPVASPSPSPSPELRPSATSTTLKHDLVWFAPWQNPSGYCSEALAFAQGLVGKLPLELVDIARTKSPAFVAGLPAHLQKILKEGLKEKADVTGRFAILHMPGNSLGHLPGSAWCIGRTMFETDRLPADWVTRCNLMDEVWVPSKFNVETFAAAGVECEKLFVMPEAADEQEFDPARHQPLPLPDRARFNFLSVFEWSTRKGWDVLLTSYFREFSASDDVCLYLRTYLVNQPDGDPTAVIEQHIREHVAKLNLGGKALPRIKILAQQIPQADLPRLYKAVDCLVAPSRGEGWGRPHHEAMLMELPVIATNWSGNTEFTNEANSYLLDYELVEAKHLEAELWHYRGHRWANPSEKHLRDLMRQVFQNPDEAKAKGRVARRHMVQNFSIAAVAEKVMGRLQAIEAKVSLPACPPVTVRAQDKLPAANPNSKPVQVAWEGSFLDLGSLSHVNREITRQLNRQSQVKLTCVGKNIVPPGLASVPALAEMARRLQPLPKQTQVTVRHAWPPSWEAPASGAWVLVQPWEFGALPAEWVRQLGRVDEAWVPSEYVRRVYVDSGVEPSKVKVVPNGVDPEKFHPGVAPMKLATRKTFKFLFVGGTIHRKGPDVLLAEYLKHFTATDDVCLVIKDFGGKGVYAGQTLEKQIQAAQVRPDAPEILYLNEELAPDALPGLYTACDCLVHPYRGEGFGLPVLEAMACGLPVVVTAGGSTDDFATDEHAYRIAARRRNIGSEVGGQKLARDGWLLEPDANALVERMKWIVTHHEEARARGRAASEYVREQWTWERAAKIAAARVQDLVARKEAAVSALAQLRSRKGAPVTLPEAALLGSLTEATELLRQKEFRSAWNATLAALTLRPFHCEAWLMLAEIARAAGDFERAHLCASRARKLAPNWRPAKQFLKQHSGKPGQSIALPSLPETPAAPRLSVCLITKNEERFLEQCLRSVADLAHQIIVVDTGSTDKTIEIAKKFNADVHSIAWTDDFSAARNESLKYATGDWILVLDADEELPAEYRATLVSEMQSADVIAYRLPIIDKGREEEGCSYVPRLFRNAPGLFFVGRVHEQIFSSLEVRRAEWGLENKLGKTALLHHGYTDEVVTSRNKIARNLRLLELAVEEMPNEPNLLMSFGLELVRSGHLEAGLEQYWEAFHVLSALPVGQIVPELRETLLTQLATQLMAARQPAEIVQLFQTPLARPASLTATQHFLTGLACMELKEPAEAAEQMRQCLAKRERPALSPANRDIFKAGPNHCLAISLTALKQDAEAEKAFTAALADDPKSRPAKFDFARFRFEKGDAIEALKLLHELVADNPDEIQVWQFGGQIALSQPEFLEFARNWTGEAFKHFPDNPVIVLHRAEALMLSQDAEQALLLWTRAHSPNSARHLAALVLCESLAGRYERHFAAADETLVSQEFMKWYRALIRANAADTVGRLNAKLNSLRSILPSFIKILEAAMKEAGQPMAA